MAIKQACFKSIRYLTLLCIIVLGMVVAIGSGGGDSSGDLKTPQRADQYDAATSTSFSPVRATTDSGESTELFWKYEINEGEPLDVYDRGISLAFDFKPLILTINPLDMERYAEIEGDVSGIADVYGDEYKVSGDYYSDAVEELDSLDESTMVDSSKITLDMKMKMAGESVKIYMDLDIDFNTPCEWFLDRENLDALPVGYAYSSRGTVYGTASGTLEITGAVEEEVAIDENVTSAEKWTILEKLDFYVVRGKTYANVIKVQRDTYVPSAGLSGFDGERTVMYYWVAKGIGMIKGVGQWRVMGEPLEIELMETNLVLDSEIE